MKMRQKLYLLLLDSTARLTAELSPDQRLIDNAVMPLRVSQYVGHVGEIS